MPAFEKSYAVQASSQPARRGDLHAQDEGGHMHASVPASASALYSAWHETTRSMRSIAVMALELAARRIATAQATLPVAS